MYSAYRFRRSYCNRDLRKVLVRVEKNEQKLILTLYMKAHVQGSKVCVKINRGLG